MADRSPDALILASREAADDGETFGTNSARELEEGRELEAAGITGLITDMFWRTAAKVVIKEGIGQSCF